MTATVLEAINQQVSNEFSASFSYLSMAGWCEHHNFMGAASWLRVQSAEEHAHGMRLFNFLLARNHSVKLMGIQAPRADFGSLVEVFEQALTQEQGVSGQIDRLYELAFSEKVFAAMAELQWFITEQVEEEKTVREIVAKLRMVGHDPASVLDIDRELGARQAAASGTAG
jgi:ferritin